jgi:hypothetical protein
MSTVLEDGHLHTLRLLLLPAPATATVVTAYLTAHLGLLPATVAAVVVGAQVQLAHEHVGVRARYHAVERAMHDLDARAADALGQLVQLRGALVVPAGGNGLQHEAAAREAGRVAPLAQLVRREAVAVGGEAAAIGVSVTVGRREPGGAEQVALHLRYLLVEGLGQEEVDAVAQVLDEALRRYMRKSQHTHRSPSPSSPSPPSLPLSPKACVYTDKWGSQKDKAFEEKKRHEIKRGEKKER